MDRYWVWEYGLFEKNPKRVDSRTPETTLEVVKLADAQATVEALQRERDEANLYRDQARANQESLAACVDRDVRKIKDLQAALDAEREKVKNTEKAYQEKARLWIEQTGALTQLQALVRAVSDTMEPFRKSMAKLDEVDTLATRRIAEADAYYCAQRVLTTLDATTPAEVHDRMFNHADRHKGAL